MAIYKSNNAGSTRNLFDQRINYLERLEYDGATNVYNFNFGERIYFGRVNSFMAPIVLRPATLRPFRLGNDAEQTMKALHFVTDIFDEMARQFEKASLLGKIDRNDKYLSSLRVYRAYESPFNEYKKLRTAYFKNFRSYILKTKRYFSNAQEFMDILMEYLEFTVKTTKFTYPGFIKSTNCSVMNSGLAIEIADLGYLNDQEKIKQFVESRNWDYYVNACNAYGFRIDQDAPWRIIMDIAAPEVLKISQRYQMVSVRSIFRKAYTSASMHAVSTFGKILYDLYNFCTQKVFHLTEDCGDDTIISKVTPQQYTTVEFAEAIPNSVLLQNYLYLRLFEEKPAMPNEIKKQIVDEVIQICIAQNNLLGIGVFFESVINKEFDKMGSLQYHFNRLKEQINSMDDLEHKADVASSEGLNPSIYDLNIEI